MRSPGEKTAAGARLMANHHQDPGAAGNAGCGLGKIAQGHDKKAMNQAGKRTSRRFPKDFASRIHSVEKTEPVTICDRFRRLEHSTALPFAYTEHYAIMAASVLNSKR